MKPYEALRNAAELLDPVHGAAEITERFCAAFALVETVHTSMLATLEKAAGAGEKERHAAKER